MNPQMLWVFGLLAACIAAFIANRPRMDAVALLALLGLVLLGILDVSEALAGFSDPSVILIAAFFVIGEGLVRTGVAYRIGHWLTNRAGNDQDRLLILLMLAVAGLGSVMSSTGVVAIFIPVALSIASRLSIPPAQLMMPLSFAALISGMLTLVGTAPNLVVHSELRRAGFDGFGFFSFTPAGLLILGLGIVYMIHARRYLGRPAAAPDGPPRRARRRLLELAADYELHGQTRRLEVSPDSSMIGHTLGELKLRAHYGANVIAIERPRRFGEDMLTTSANREILAGDILFVHFADDNVYYIASFIERMGLIDCDFGEDHLTSLTRELGLAEVTIPPGSQLIGKSILDLRMRSQRGINVMGLRRRGRCIQDMLHEKLRMGDTLLVAGTWKSIRLLHTQAHDFLVLSLPAEIDEAAPAARRAPLALLALGITVGLMVSGAVPNVVAALIGCLLLGAFRCLDMESAYRAIHWQSLILIVGMLPFALALQKTGGIELLVGSLLELTGTASPRLVLGALFAMTALVGLFISNTATAVLMAPIGIGVAQQLGTSPYPFAMTIALAASAAFMTPVSSPVNTLVLGPGQYRFGDFVKIGVPFTLIVMVVCILVLPLLFPF